MFSVNSLVAVYFIVLLCLMKVSTADNAGLYSFMDLPAMQAITAITGASGDEENPVTLEQHEITEELLEITRQYRLVIRPHEVEEDRILQLRILSRFSNLIAALDRLDLDSAWVLQFPELLHAALNSVYQIQSLLVKDLLAAHEQTTMVTLTAAQKESAMYAYLLFDAYISIFPYAVDEQLRIALLHTRVAKVNALELAVYLSLQPAVERIMILMAAPGLQESLWRDHGALSIAAKHHNIELIQTLLKLKDAHADPPEDAADNASVTGDVQTLESLYEAGMLNHAQYDKLRSWTVLSFPQTDGTASVVITEEKGQTHAESSRDAGDTKAVHERDIDTGGWPGAIPTTHHNTVHEFLDTIPVSCPFQTISAEDDARIEEMLRDERPFIVRNLGKKTKSELTNIYLHYEKFMTSYGSRTVRVGDIPYSSLFGYQNETKMTLAEFAASLESEEAFDVNDSDIQHRPYVFESFFFSNDDNSDAIHVPSQLKLLSSGLRSVLSEWDTLDKCDQFYCGGVSSGAPFHFHCTALNLLAYGEKHWYFTVPSERFYSSQHPYEYLQAHPEAGKLHCVQYPGDLFYIPSFWGHGTINTKATSVGVALEYDFGHC